MLTVKLNNKLKVKLNNKLTMKLNKLNFLNVWQLINYINSIRVLTLWSIASLCKRKLKTLESKYFTVNSGKNRNINFNQQKNAKLASCLTKG